METEPTWRELTADDLPAVAELAGRCLAADGGLPLVAEPGFLGRRFAVPGGTARGAADATGRLVAAGAVRPQERDGARHATHVGLVDPRWRGRGLGSTLLDWGLGTASRMADGVTVETEALTADAEALFAGRGLHRTFLEEVMRFDLAATRLPALALPERVRLAEWSAERAGRFFAVYVAAFRDRPGFPGWSERQWVDWTEGDDEFRPQWSLLATDPEQGDVGFITCAQGWIVQVGTPPDQRGRGIGAGLAVEALRRMRAGGAVEALLDVNADNPAGELYRRLGFAVIGRRARFEPGPRAGSVRPVRP